MKTMKEIRISRWGQACESRGDKSAPPPQQTHTLDTSGIDLLVSFFREKQQQKNNLQLIFLLTNFIIVINSYLFWQFDEKIVLVSYSSCGYCWAPSGAPQHMSSRCAVLLLHWAAQALVGTGAPFQHFGVLPRKMRACTKKEEDGRDHKFGHQQEHPLISINEGTWLRGSVRKINLQISSFPLLTQRVRACYDQVVRKVVWK